MLTKDFVNNVLDNISYCEDYLLYLRANNLISDKDELSYIIDDIQNELWSDDTLLYDSKDISFSEFTKTDNDMLMTVGQLKERISENYDIALEEIYKNKEEIER